MHIAYKVIKTVILEADHLSESLPKEIAVRIKSLREQKGYNMAELAKITDVTRSLISQIEKGDALPSLNTLSKIVDALGITLSTFFITDSSSKSEDDFILRAGTHKRVIIPGSNVVYNILTPFKLSPLGFALVEFPPGSREGSFFQHDGFEYIYVLEGELEITIGDSNYTLYAGDSACYDSSLPHFFQNNTSRDGKILLAGS